jgi:hypothetical protein
MKDLRSYARQTNVRLIIGAFLILIIVGEGLIYLFYGPGGAVTGLLCIGSGLIPIFLIIAILYGMEWLVKRNNDKNG